ncbi:restriction endonuclease [Streptomyces sp. NPDC049813]|uniref:restriction endonuclease n=1 Tax=Streptomyces sp. NPDC049813 TaxID=3365597 RepID=UPI00378E61C3
MTVNISSLAVGDSVRRVHLHEQYGGNRQTGISYPSRAPYIFLFTHHTRGQQYGYNDGWGKDGLYHYCGEGKNGDQKMTLGNKAILEHAKNGRSIYLFEYVRSGVHELRGEFELDRQNPWYTAESQGFDGCMRTVIMFRLVPRFSPRSLEPHIMHTPVTQPVIEDIELEAYRTDQAALPGLPAAPSPAVRRESPLVQAYGAHLRARGHRVGRKRLYPSGELNALLTDLFDYTSHTLVEAKGTTTREAVRMAIGQLYDYRRLISPVPTLALLTPNCPRTDLRDLCASMSIHLIWRDGEQFPSQPPAAHEV